MLRKLIAAVMAVTATGAAVAVSSSTHAATTGRLEAIPAAVEVSAGAPAVRTGLAAPAPRACPIGAQVVVIGDSITELGAPALRQLLAGAGYDPQINSRGGRTIAQGWEVAWGYGEEIGITRCWVIALGTNDMWYPSTTGIQYDMLKLLSFVPQGEPVWWVQVAVPGGDAVNRLVAVANPLVPATLIAWVPTAVDLVADGVHTSTGGRRRWATTVLASITA